MPGDGIGGSHGHVAQALSVAAKMALPTAGARPTRPVSPAPAGVMSLRSIEHDLNLRRVAEAGKAIALEVRIEDAAVGELDGFEERAADALDDRAHVLVAQAVGIDDGAGLPGADDADDA